MNNDISEILKRLFEYLTANGWQEPKMYDLLTTFMRGKYYPNDEILFEKGDIIDYTFFLSSGFFTFSVYNSKCDKQITEIVRAGEIVSTPSFTKQSPSVHDLNVIAGSYAIYLNHSEMEEVYRQFPKAHDLTKKIMANWEEKGQQVKLMLAKRGIERVFEFYTTYPELLEPGAIMRDAEIASYLLLAERSLGALRTRLFNSGRLTNPATLKNKSFSITHSEK
ncbi:Crp/Fnr family transcriptional regulator [Pedobacter hiemivivus]|uniref:Crp/Fnr family transcriptional regulator n=1 Tax=Pedobacter hiemivivus TaxID=2530454 RepID=A0A4R0NER3_9SPHI|nr:cyclic nucleotide-binding domain-containing protein [Pedobacter hiemivivus]TCC98845.1 Crp/Fnr family transcriptional regulator [Pedobacter hiemivivus]